jgi:hypothetical protein
LINRVIFNDPPVAKRHHAMRKIGDVTLVGNHYDGHAPGIQLLQQSHHLTAGQRVQGPGRLIGKYQHRIVDQGARNGHALLLAAGELRRVVMAAFGQPYLGETRSRALFALFRWNTAVQQRQ